MSGKDPAEELIKELNGRRDGGLYTAFRFPSDASPAEIAYSCDSSGRACMAASAYFRAHAAILIQDGEVDAGLALLVHAAELQETGTDYFALRLAALAHTPNPGTNGYERTLSLRAAEIVRYASSRARVVGRLQKS